MGFYVNPLPWLKLCRTRRGWRAGIGPRWLRVWRGAGGSGVSTGAGPFSYYRPAGQRKPRPRTWHGTLPGGWRCPHAHRSQDKAVECARKELRRREHA
jgi:hypothetical protein